VSGVQVDLRGEAVTVATFLSILSGKWSADTPENLRLRSGPNSNLLVYMTGHGGDGFLKFQDAEEVSSQDLADAFHAAYVNGKYGSALFLIDTCQGATMFSRFYAPNVVAIASSALGENSYSHHSDNRIGVAIIDRFTFYLLGELSRISMNSTLTLEELFDRISNSPVHSTVQWRTDLLQDRAFEDLLVTDYFGMVQQVAPVALPSTAATTEPLPVVEERVDVDEMAAVRAAVSRSEALLHETSAARLAASLPPPVAPLPFEVRNPSSIVPLVLVALLSLVAFSVAVDL
jgi:glycosylphosphatidylinositol transamidase (GPIT) subunit GPI8